MSIPTFYPFLNDFYPNFDFIHLHFWILYDRISVWVDFLFIYIAFKIYKMVWIYCLTIIYYSLGFDNKLKFQLFCFRLWFAYQVGTLWMDFKKLQKTQKKNLHKVLKFEKLKNLKNFRNQFYKNYRF